MLKTYFFCCCLLATALPAFTQQYYYKNFYDVTQQPCPFDSTVTVTYPEGWTIYQTLDGTWGGEMDASRCISVEQFASGGNLRIALEQVNPAEPLFIRALSSELASLGELPVNQYMVTDFFWYTTGDIIMGPNCVEDLCTGAFMGIDVGVPGAMRIHTGLVDQENLEIHSCFPTEYFQGQYLGELILKVTFAPNSDLSGKYLDLFGVEVSPNWYPLGYISDVEASQVHYNNGTGEYDVDVYSAANSGGIFDQFLMLYTEPTFPSVSTPSYVMGNVNPPSSEQQTINLIVEDYQTLEIQPFTQLRGALVEGSNSLRHMVNLVNNGGDLCVNFLDLIYSGGNEYRHGKGGSLTFNNSFSCFQFRNGSALHVMDDATLHYGAGGAGMLALCANSTVVLEKNATLLVDAILNIAECDDAIAPTHIYLDLPKTASLIFTENAHLTNRFSQGQQMELRVRMLGGTLDDSRLSAEDRALIRRIYPEPAPIFADNFSISPNPFQAAPLLSYVSETAETLSLQWFSTEGKLIGTTQLSAQQGINEWTLENTPQQAGIYLLRIENGTKNAMLKMVRGD